MAQQTETPIINDASKGLVTARDPSTLAPGELTVARSCEYRVGSPHLYKLPGRSTTGTALGANVLAINKLQYDSATDVLAADAGGTVWESAVSTAPVFASSGLTGLSTTAIPQYTGVRNRWIRCDGIDDNYIREGGAPPGGTTGYWRSLGMIVAGVPSLNAIATFSTANQIVKPTAVANQPVPSGAPLSATVGYHDTQLAYDAVGVGTGTCTGAAGQQVITGSAGAIFLTQLAVGSVVTFTSTGEVVTVQSIAANTQFTTTANLSQAISASGFTYTGTSSTPDPLTTRAWSSTGDCSPNPSIAPTDTTTCIWKFTTNLAAPNRTLSIRHNGAVSPPDQAPTFGPAGMTWHIEYSINSGTTWADLGPSRHQPFLSVIEDSVSIPDTADTSTLWVRATVIATGGLVVSGHRLTISHAIYDIKLTNGATSAYNATNAIFYGVSEVYIDSDGVEHQSNMGTIVSNDGTVGPLRISNTDLQNVSTVVLNLPAKVNPLATKFIVWRSVDTPGGGYPVMYAIGSPAITDTLWTDTMSVRPDDTGTISTFEQYKILEVLYSTGESLFASFYSKPPISFKSLLFQGCVCYFPSGTDFARRVYYSLPTTVSVNAMEQVPEQYYLDFQTPTNDTVVGGAITNGGRSMLVFFENYTMLVNYLPQGADPGGFNNTVKEYVSDKRGCAGHDASTEFTLPSGQTLVASVDGLGLWITNGVNLVEEWSNDLDWATLITGVDLTTVILVDKPHKRRLEMLYTDATSTRQELHFFYGRMKQGAPDGKTVPLITGPHPSGIRSKSYTMIDGQWRGFSGDAAATGNVFYEDSQAADDSHAYDSTGIVPWTWVLGDMYVSDIHEAHIVENAGMKFTDDLDKDFVMTGVFTRDAGTSTTIYKAVAVMLPQYIYWHQYCDRHRVGWSDLTNTAAPAFVRYVVTTRPAGPARDL